MTAGPAKAQQILAQLADQWRPVLPEVDAARLREYTERFDLLMHELRDCAAAGSVRATCALSGQVLEFVLKVRLESAGIDRRQLSGFNGTLGDLIKKAQQTPVGVPPRTILFDASSVEKAGGGVNYVLLDAIPHRDLVQHSILQAKEYRNDASHAAPWREPLGPSHAARQMGAIIALCEHIAPSLPPPTGSPEHSQIAQLRDLRAKGVDLSIAFLPERSVNRVYQMITQLRREEGEAGTRTLIDAVASNPMWLFARSITTTPADLRQLIQVIYAAGHHEYAHAAAVLLPINDLALTHIVRRYGQGFSDHMMMAKEADRRLFATLLSRVYRYPWFVNAFCEEVVTAVGASSGPSKADYLVRGFGNLPSVMRNHVLLTLGATSARAWLEACQFGYGPGILSGLSDAAVAKVPALGPIRDNLRDALIPIISAAPPRYLVNAYLSFCHGQPGPYRQRCYEAIFQSLKKHAYDNAQAMASCRALLEIVLTVDMRGQTWVKGQGLAAICASETNLDGARLIYNLVAAAMDPKRLTSLPSIESLDLPNLVAQEALVVLVMLWCLASAAATTGSSDATRSVLRDARDRANAVVNARSRISPNVIVGFLRQKRYLDVLAGFED